MADGNRLDAALEDVRVATEQTLELLLPRPEGPEKRLIEAMRYATLGGGKRLRAFLAIQTGGLFAVDRQALGRVAAAVECIHAYSLVHDDLPCMDDDDLRRGRPSAHRRFDEATAVLAGDALQAFAFELLASPPTHADPFVRAELVARLAHAVGPAGMVGGQMIDMESEGKAVDVVTITRLERLKTGALIVFAAEAGAIMGRAAPSQRQALVGYAQDLGLAFQIADDLLDVEGRAEDLGKAAGAKDARKGKANFVTLLGLEPAREQAKLLSEQAVSHVHGFDARADLLRDLARFVIARKA